VRYIHPLCSCYAGIFRLKTFCIQYSEKEIILLLFNFPKIMVQNRKYKTGAPVGMRTLPSFGRYVNPITNGGGAD
jgi:hypothetical protein